MTATTSSTSVGEPAATPASRPAPTARLGRWTGPQLDPRRNSLNLIRLVLALAVLWHHAYPLGGFTGHPAILGVQLGGWAVFGFFAISGYLITSSRFSRPLGSYLVQRIFRIYPAFWVCLLVTAAVFAPIAYVHASGGIDGYLTTGPVTPIDYVLRNLTLRIDSYQIGTTLADTPYPGAWNGSLWTLYYEFACYLIVGALGCLAWWRRHSWPTLVAFVLTVVAYARWEQLAPYVGGNVDLRNLLQLLPFFLGGSAVYRYRHLLPLHGLGAVASALAVWAAIALSVDWGLQAAAPFLLYLVLWIGHRMPSPAWIRKNDLSYGTYIYAFAVQQLLASLGLHEHGILVYTAVTVALTAVLASASWFLVERPVMRRARR